MAAVQVARSGWIMSIFLRQQDVLRDWERKDRKDLSTWEDGLVIH